MKNSSYLKNNGIKSIAIGGFDGLHLAHQELFKKLDECGAIVVIESGYSNITPKEYRENFTDLPIFYYDLASIKHLSADEFMENLLTKFPKLELIIIGYDFAFGNNRTHSAKDLQDLFKSVCNGKTKIVEEFKIDNISVHSKAIREYIQSDNIKMANRLLGRNYEIMGQIISGQGLGEKSFVPTINLEVQEFILPCEGVYTTITIIDDIRYNSVSFLGHRVSTDGSYAVETHLLNTKIDIKDRQNIKIEFIQKQRNNHKFDSFEELKNQILEDIKVTKEYFRDIFKLK
jgi:riboflavin kinase/FMN adenylyltransferase